MTMIMILGLSLFYSSIMTSVNSGEIYGKSYISKFEQAASQANNCSKNEVNGIICINNSPQTQGTNNVIETQITTDQQLKQTSSVGPSESTVFVLWTESNSKISFKRSIDGGNTFGNNIDLSNDASCCSMPSAASFHKNVYVVWSSGESPDDILFKKSSDGGATFDKTINLSNTPNRSFQAAIAVFGNNVYVVWSDGTPDDHDILFRKSNDGGSTFGSTINLSEELSGYSEQPSVAVYQNKVHIVWRETTASSDEIFYQRSVDGGITFSDSTNLSNSEGNSAVPVVATSGNNVYVAWADGSPSSSNFETLLRRSIDNGATFDSIVNLSNSDGNSGEISIATSGDNVYVAWGEFTGDSIEIQYRLSADNGATFGAAVNLSNNDGESYYPRIALLNDNVYVVWNDNSFGNFEIFYRKSIDKGITFGNINDLSNSNEMSISPTITASVVSENAASTY